MWKCDEGRRGDREEKEEVRRRWFGKVRERRDMVRYAEKVL